MLAQLKLQRLRSCFDTDIRGSGLSKKLLTDISAWRTKESSLRVDDQIVCLQELKNLDIKPVVNEKSHDDYDIKKGRV